MAVIGSGLQIFYSDSQAAFDTLATNGDLVVGGIYFVGNTIYLAVAEDEYNVYGGTKVGTPPSDPEEFIPGIFYYNPVTKEVFTAIWDVEEEEFALVNVGATFIGVKKVDDKVYLVRADGSEVLMPLPITTSINATTPSNNVLPAESAVVNYVMTEIGKVVGGIRYVGELIPGTTTIATATRGDLYRVSAAGTFLSATLVAGDWVVFNTDTVSPASGEFDVFSGVENAAIAALTSDDNVLPLAASQGKVLKGLVDDLEEGKLDKFAAGDGGNIVTTASDGTLVDTLTVATSVNIADPGSASATALTNEQAVASAINSAVAAAAVKWKAIP